MKYILLINIFFLFWGKFNRIAEVNALKEDASVFYQKKAYKKSILIYEKLLAEYKEKDESVVLNLANCYFQLKRYNSAIDTYKLLINSKEFAIKSKAYLQLGVIYGSNNKKELGLSYFKEALKAMPSNEEARYNFELLKKEHNENQKNTSPDKKKENKDGKNKTSTSTSEASQNTNNGSDSKNKNPEEQSQEGEEENEEDFGGEQEEELQYDNTGDKEVRALTSKRLAEMNMNERQARMILKTMKNSEMQYLQQHRKIGTSKRTPSKQDW